LSRYQIPKGTPSAEALIQGGWENWRFSTKIAVYLGNGTRYAHDYYGTLTGSHGCPDRVVSFSMTLSDP